MWKEKERGLSYNAASIWANRSRSGFWFSSVIACSLARLIHGRQLVSIARSFRFSDSRRLITPMLALATVATSFFMTGLSYYAAVSVARAAASAGTKLHFEHQVEATSRPWGCEKA